MAEAAATVVEQEGEGRGLQQADAHRHVAGGLGDLALPDGAHLLPLLDAGNDHAEDLHDDRRRDVGQDAEREDGELRQGTTGEQAEERKRSAFLVGAVSQHLNCVDVDARRRDVGPDAVQHEHGQRERDLVSQVFDPEHVQDACSSHCFSLRSLRPTRSWALSVGEGPLDW